MEQSVEVIADSIGPNGKRVTTIVANHMRLIHPELLRHRLFSFSVASSRAIPYAKQMEQVKNDPALPVLWPKQHKGMQGTEVITDPIHRDHLDGIWKHNAQEAIKMADDLTERGISKQLTNRLLEPWVMTRAVITATNWDNFFRLRHPWHYNTGDMGSPRDINDICWQDRVNLNFPAEYNIQDLAIRMKKSLDESTPNKLEEGQWHLPFITTEDRDDVYTRIRHGGEVQDMMIKLSAARCARTSYNKERGKTVEDDLKLADMLMNDHHWSPFEHQAQAISDDYENHYDDFKNLPDGLQFRIENDGIPSLWSRNFQEWVQARALLDT